MQFLYGDRELRLDIQDLLTAPVDVIVNPTNCYLTHEDVLASKILAQAGNQLQQDSTRLIEEYGQIESGMAVFTQAGNLQYKAIIHAVTPSLGDGDEQATIEQLVSRSLQLCEINEWGSIAFPALGTGEFKIPVATSAKAFFRAITHFWDARHECHIDKIMICLSDEEFRPFFDMFREDAIETDQSNKSDVKDTVDKPAGIINISDQDIEDTNDNEIDDWFK